MLSYGFAKLSHCKVLKVDLIGVHREIERGLTMRLSHVLPLESLIMALVEPAPVGTPQ